MFATFTMFPSNLPTHNNRGDLRFVNAKMYDDCIIPIYPVLV